MKKIALVLASGLAMASVANAEDFAMDLNQGVYVSATANVSNTSIDDTPLSRSAITPKIAIGYDFGTYRVELNYADLGKLKHHVNSNELNVKLKNLGVSAMYNFAPEKAFQPYLGGRLIYTKASLNAKVYNHHFSDSEKKFGFGAMLGAEYRLDSNIFTGINFEYDRLASNASSASAGISIRYKF